MDIYDPFFIENAVRDMTKRDRKKFKGTEKEFRKFIREKINKSIPPVLSSLRKLITKHSVALAKDTLRHDRIVFKEISSSYKGAIDFLDPFISYNAWIGEMSYSKYRKVFKNDNDRQKIYTLLAIHSRACQIAREIKLLVRHGYADGAMARWRSLHELCVTFLFLFDHDDEVLQMYLEYEVIESYNKMERHDASLTQIGWRPISPKVRKDLEEQREQLIERYGKQFTKDYGWAMKILPPVDRHFRGMEKLVQQDHLRGVYAWASDNVHAGISGNKKRLGLSPKNANKFLQISSPVGIFDPIQFTTYTLVEMSGTLLDMEDSSLNKMYIQLLSDMQKLLVNDLKDADKKFVKKYRTVKKGQVI